MIRRWSCATRNHRNKTYAREKFAAIPEHAKPSSEVVEPTGFEELAWKIQSSQPGIHFFFSFEDPQPVLPLQEPLIKLAFHPQNKLKGEGRRKSRRRTSSASLGSKTPSIQLEIPQAENTIRTPSVYSSCAYLFQNDFCCVCISRRAPFLFFFFPVPCYQCYC